VTTEATTFSTHIRGQDAVHKPFAKPTSLSRFRYFIEHTDWDEVILTHDEWIDKTCIVIIIAASLYLIPTAVAMLFLR